MNGHPTREEDFDLYALGALEGDEKRAIESHVATCESCAQRLAEARGRIALLALAAPPAAPSSAVKARLMSRIRAEGHGETGASPLARAGIAGRLLRTLVGGCAGARGGGAADCGHRPVGSEPPHGSAARGTAFRYAATAAGIAGSARSGRLDHGAAAPLSFRWPLNRECPKEQLM